MAGAIMKKVFSYGQLPITQTFKVNWKRSQLSGVRVIGSWKQMTGNKEKTVFTVFICIHYILIKFNYREVEWKLSNTFLNYWETKESKTKKQEKPRYCELHRFQRNQHRATATELMRFTLSRNIFNVLNYSTECFEL